jgi:hypothetical protein
VEGALCVAHVRVPENTNLDRLAATCPRLRGRLGPQHCSEAAAAAGRLGHALMFNRSP